MNNDLWIDMASLERSDGGACLPFESSDSDDEDSPLSS